MLCERRMEEGREGEIDGWGQEEQEFGKAGSEMEVDQMDLDTLGMSWEKRAFTVELVDKNANISS